MNDTTGDRWVKRILRYGKLTGSLYGAAFGCLMNLAFSLYFAIWTESWFWGVFLALGVQAGYTAILFWERNAWIRFVERKVAEAQSLRRELELSYGAKSRSSETGIEPHSDT